MKAFTYSALAAAAGILVALILAAVAGEGPVEVLSILFRSSFGSRFGLGYTLYYATPLLLAGLAVALPYRAGLFNVGAEGQLLAGALTCAGVGVLVPRTPTLLALPLGVLSAAAGGAVWAFLAGWLKARRGTHEVIATILLNIVAASLVNWFILNPLKDPSSQVPETVAIGSGFRLGPKLLAGTPANPTLVIAVIAALALHFALKRTKKGYEIRVVGGNPNAARTAGIDDAKVYVQTMVAGGAIAGLVGVNEVMGQAFRLKDGFSPGYGYTGIAVALLGRGHPLGVIPAALFFGALHKGASGLDLDTERITRDLALVMQAAIILIVAAEKSARESLVAIFRGGRRAEGASIAGGSGGRSPHGTSGS